MDIELTPPNWFFVKLGQRWRGLYLDIWASSHGKSGLPDMTAMDGLTGRLAVHATNQTINLSAPDYYDIYQVQNRLTGPFFIVLCIVVTMGVGLGLVYLYVID
jgi:hypothetical protein